MYKKIIENGFIVAISDTIDYGEDITEQEYNTIINLISNKPQVASGFVAMLNNRELEWEIIKAQVDEDSVIATEIDYENALKSIGAIE